MNTELFQVETSLSPFLRWKEKHKIPTYYCDGIENPWCALAPGLTLADVSHKCVHLEDIGDLVLGDSEEGVCIQIAKNKGIPWIHGEKL